MPEGAFTVDIPMVIVASSKGEALINGIQSVPAGGDMVSASFAEDDAAEQALFEKANLYISNNSTRTQKYDDLVSFTVALKSVVYAGSAATGQYFVDAMPIASMPGTYIANVVGSGGIRTVISYDKGSFWNTLKLEVGVDVKEGDSLHIGLNYAQAVSGLPVPESIDTATGLVLANGWFGKAAPQVAPERFAETFASRDGTQS